jgi:hypothetical protein
LVRRWGVVFVCT